MAEPEDAAEEPARRPQRGGQSRAVRAVVDAAPTSRHAEMLFDMVTASLGERAQVASVAKGSWRRLFRRDAS